MSAPQSHFFKAVFFDLDGTLTDSKRTIFRCLNSTLDKFGYSTYTEEEIYPLIGTLQRRGMFYRKGGEIPDDKLQKMIEFYNELYLSTYRQDTSMFSGIMDVLKALKGAGILTGIITIKKGFIARRLAQEMGFDQYIDVVVGDGDAKLKPAPDPILTACKSLGVDPRFCAMVGDAPGDIVSGKVAGCKTIGVTWGANSGEKLADAGADWIAKGTDVLRDLLLPDDIVRRGAEAEIHKTVFMGRPAIQKKRVPKSYRIPQVDCAIREARTKEETKLLSAARAAGIDVPALLDVDLARGEITMEFVPGWRAKDLIEDESTTTARRKALCRGIGASAAKLHNAGIIHGDLTTSNIIVRPSGALCFIDFGLGEFSKEIEKQGVDLHVLMEAFESTHSRFPYCFGEVMKGYKAGFKNGKGVEEKIKEIVKRGRYMRSHE
ncbi:MAG: KEOPS complex kinase/ATPase Bud32 [Candidatus Thermoplasmatota archaeon]|nr:KEOPS complex kinase/ATPase Bud32 [Candidatus Thermoplasmatota archaeon]